MCVWPGGSFLRGRDKRSNGAADERVVRFEPLSRPRTGERTWASARATALGRSAGSSRPGHLLLSHPKEVGGGGKGGTAQTTRVRSSVYTSTRADRERSSVPLWTEVDRSMVGEIPELYFFDQSMLIYLGSLCALFFRPGRLFKCPWAIRPFVLSMMDKQLIVQVRQKLYMRFRASRYQHARGCFRI